jgi:hypothetical protein
MNDFFLKWLNYLDKKELRDFRQYATLVLENLGIYVKAVIDRLSKWKNGKTDKKIEKHSDLIKKIKEKEGDRYLTNITKDNSTVKKTFVDFLVIKEAQKDAVFKEKILFKSAQKRNFSDGYFYQLLSWEKTLENTTQSFDFEYDMFQINYFRYFHPEFQKSKPTSTHHKEEYIPKEVLANSWNHIELFRLIAQTRLACEIEYQKWKLEDKTGYLDEVGHLDIGLIEQFIPQNVALNVYFKIYKWIKTKDFDDLNGLKTTITFAIENIQLFSVEEQMSILLLLNNCIGRTMRFSDKQVQLKIMLTDIAITGFTQDIFGKQTDLDLNFFLGMYDKVSEVNLDFARTIKDIHSQKLPTKSDNSWAIQCINARELMQECKFHEAYLLLKKLDNHSDYSLTTRKFVMLIQCVFEINKQVMSNEVKDIKIKGVAEEETWMNIIKNIHKTFKHSSYTKNASKTKEHIALFKFAEVASMLFLRTHSLSEIKNIIHNVHAADWLKQQLSSYTKYKIRSILDNKLKTYDKILNLLSLENANSQATD